MMATVIEERATESARRLLKRRKEGSETGIDRMGRIDRAVYLSNPVKEIMKI